MTTKTSAQRAKAVAAGSGVEVWTSAKLSDARPAQTIAELVERAKQDPEFAKRWLLQKGFVTPGGKLPKRFGG